MRIWQGQFSRFAPRLDFHEHQYKILLLLALVVSAIVGFVVVAFVALTEYMSRVLVGAGPLWRAMAPFAGSLVAGWLLFRFFPEARGSGIPQTQVALLLEDGFIRFRAVIGKFICSSISLGSGVALGREGPSVHMGAGIASVVARKLGLGEEHVRALVPVGTAAAIAAAFNTPLAAVLFTLEEILSDLNARVVGSIVLGAAASWIVLRSILGDEPLFHVPSYQLVHPLEFLIYALLGVLGGLVSTLFVKLLLWQRAVFLKTPRRWQPFTPGVGGLVVGLLALAAPGVVGVGYNLVSDALNGKLILQTMLVLLAFKLIATTTCYGSGNAGGIFGPSLFIGAMLGGAVGQVAHSLFPAHTGNAGAYALVGMGAVFAGIVQTPMTSVIMIFEVTRDYVIIVPLMIANLCSYVLARKLTKLPVYEALSRQDGVVMPSAAHESEPLTVKRAMRQLSEEEKHGAGAYPVGLYTHPDDTLDSALQLMGRAGVEEIPVVSRAGQSPVGTLRAGDVLDAYRGGSSGEIRADSARAQNWAPIVAATAVAGLIIVSGLALWQRSRQAELAKAAFSAGQELLAHGRGDEAILAYRSALAHNPGSEDARTALGLALIQTGQFTEGATYLSDVVKVNASNGPAWFGLAQAALAANEKEQARQCFRQSLTGEWPEGTEAQRRRARLDYGALLSEIGRRSEGIAELISVIEQSGDDPSIAKQAADAVQRIGTPEQAEEAYGILSRHFPADPTVLLRLGDARISANKEARALAAYRQALSVAPDNAEAATAVERAERMVQLDPTPRNLSVRERARRWDLILQRVVHAATACASPPEMERAKRLLRSRSTTVEISDQKMEAALDLWSRLAVACKSDPVLTHIFTKIAE